MSQSSKDTTTGPSLFLHPPSVESMRDPLAAEWNLALRLDAPDELVRLIDFSRMNGIFENFLEVVGLPVAIIDLNGRVLASSRWQRLCMDFHRVNQDTLARCLESDTELSREMAEGRTYAIYRCRNGLTDCATPIVLDGVHVANLFVGQFLLAPPDLAAFRRQQEEFGFDREAYFAALAEVPVVAEAKLPAILRLMGGLAQQIASQSLSERRIRAAFTEAERLVEQRTRALAETGDLLRRVAAQVPGLVYQFVRDAAGRYHVPFASDAARSLFGLEPEELRHDISRLLDRLHPDDLAPLLESIEVSAASLTPWRHEFRILRPDQPERWLWGDAVPSRGANGSVLWHGFITDVTERKRTELLLEARLRLIHAPGGLHELLVATLDEACALTGSAVGFYYFLERDQVTLSLQAWSTRTTREFCRTGAEATHYPVDSAGVWADSVRQGRSVVYNDYAALPHRKGLPEGHGPVARLMSIPIRRDDRITAIIGIGNKATDYDDGDLRIVEALADMAWDAVERRRAEEAVVAAKDTAERRAEELASSNAELEQFAYIASHDLREPLRMINSFLMLVERGYADKLDDEGKEYIKFARDGAMHMNQLILDLLEYSRIGRHGAPPESVALADIANEAVRNLRTLIAETGCAVTIDATPARVSGNRTELVRLLQNVIGNALKYRAADRPPRVELSWRRQATGWLVSVRDNGIGIAPEYHGEIFKIFRRLHARSDYEGTGIGLAVCHKIVKNHGGRIWLDSVPGQGSTFFFTLESP